MKLMEEANRVTAYLKVTAEFYDPEATPETVRACVEQDLTDAGYEVEVVPFDKHNNEYCKLVPGVVPPPPECADERDYKQDYIDFVNLVTDGKFDHAVPFGVAKSRYMGSLMQKLPLKNRRKDILKELVWYREGLIKNILPEYVDALITAITESERRQHGNWIPVKDKPPDHHEPVFVYSSANGRMTARYTTSGQWLGDSGYYVEDVTHWMPFPDKPEDVA